MKKFMGLNKEQAGRLWVQQFGKKQKAFDFSGREIAKAAYNDRNSNYGWNVDHILPQSRGGKTVDYNLICCHILTNDEKADKFPCFNANAKEFEIQKRQNHYEIIARSQVEEDEYEYEDTVNFLDVAQGLKLWRKCKNRNGEVFVGYVKIKVELSNESDQLLERFENFLAELFETKSIFVEKCSQNFCEPNDSNRGLIVWSKNKRYFIFTIIDYEVSQKKCTENLLDNCITLNTYREYFIDKTGFEEIKIVCGMECYESYFEMSSYCQEEIMKKKVTFIDTLAIDELVKQNTSAKKELKSLSTRYDLYPYNFVWTKLQKSLLK